MREGNLALVERALPAVGEIQVADVPGRCEPGTGEIRCPAVAAALARLGYTGVVGLEGWASGDPELALGGSARRSQPGRVRLRRHVERDRGLDEQDQQAVRPMARPTTDVSRLVAPPCA